jgi:hypothetical protein
VVTWQRVLLPALLLLLLPVGACTPPHLATLAAWLLLHVVLGTRWHHACPGTTLSCSCHGTCCCRQQSTATLPPSS